MPALIPQARRERRLRDLASRHGYRLRKSRVKTPNLDDLGGYQLLFGSANMVAAGARFELDLDDVEEFLNS